MISITVPIYNEKETLQLLHDKIREVMLKLGRPWELIFVNDGSNDGTGELLDQLASQFTEVKVVHFRRNFGQTAAMMAGFDFASGDVIIPLDGDFQNDPEDIPRMLNKLDEGYDVCSGWRRDRQDEAIRRNHHTRSGLSHFVSGSSPVAHFTKSRTGDRDGCVYGHRWHQIHRQDGMEEARV